MKKLLIAFAVLVTLFALTTAVLAANDADVKIYTARDLITEFNAGAIVPTNLNISEVLDDTGHYMRAMSTSNTKHIIAWTLAEEMAPDFDVMIIGFRTNYTDTSSSSGSTGLDFPKDSKFDYKNRYFASPVKRDTFEAKDGIVADELVFKGLLKKFQTSETPTVKYIKINPFNGKPFVLAEGQSESNISASSRTPKQPKALITTLTTRKFRKTMSLIP